MQFRYKWFVLGAFLYLFSACSRPVAKFVVDTESNYEAPVSIQFTNQSEEAETFIWHLGDGTTSTEAEPVHEYLQSGNYEISLTAIKGKSQRTFKQVIQIAPPEKCLAYLQTAQGNLLVELFNETPLHRDNFLKLADEEYFNGLIFHRVIKGFMIQGGDPNSREADTSTRLGGGGPGYQIPAEINTHHFHFKGALAAARTGDAINPEKKSSGSQFYIVQGKPVTNQMIEVLQAQKGITYTEEQKQQYINFGGTPFLDNEYTVFGQVIRGMEVIDKIANAPTGQSDRPMEDVIMKIKVIK